MSLSVLGQGGLAKMNVELASPVNYQLPVGDERLPLK